MLIAVAKPRAEYEKKKRVEELLREFANGKIKQEIFESKLKKLQIGQLRKYL